MIQTRISNQHMLSPILKIKSRKLHSIFVKLRPTRQKRWESLGKAWKYVSGSPDAEDLRMINSTINSLIDQNNRQIIINSALNIRLSNITGAINSLVSFQSNLHDVTVEGFDSINLIFNIDELIDQLGTIEEAITLARFNIPSSRILSTDETTVAQEFLSNRGLGTSLFNDILDISGAYVLFGKNEIIYTLKVPRVKDIEYQLSYIEPVISHGHRIHLTAKYYLKGPNSFLMNNPCTKHRNQYVCKNTQLQPLEKCIQQLINGDPAHCPMEKVYGQNYIKRVDDANIIVNAEHVILNSNCSGHERKLQGSYLIQFSGCTIKLNGEEYSNSNTDLPARLYLPTTGIMVTPSKIINKMPLQYLQEFNLEHRSHIEHLNMTADNLHWKLHLVGWLSFGTLSTVILILLAALVTWTVLSSLWGKSKSTWEPGQTNKETIHLERLTEPGTLGPTKVNSGHHFIQQPRFIPQNSRIKEAEDDFHLEGESLGKQ